MSRNGRGQVGYAEPPFSPSDPPAKREELRKAGNYAELPFTPAGLRYYRRFHGSLYNRLVHVVIRFGLRKRRGSAGVLALLQ